MANPYTMATPANGMPTFPHPLANIPPPTPTPAKSPSTCPKRSTALKSKPEQRLPDPSTPDLLLMLPPELRNIIYELVVVEKKAQNVYRYKHKPYWSQPGLLLTCKQVRQEALLIYYAGNVFDVRVELEKKQFGPVMVWLNRTVRQIRSQPGNNIAKVFADLRLHIFGSVWLNLEAFDLLLEFTRTTGLKVAIIKAGQENTDDGRAEIEALRQDFPVFVTLSGQAINVQEAVGALLKLGEKAHGEGWDKQTLDAKVRAEREKRMTSGPGRQALRQHEAQASAQRTHDAFMSLQAAKMSPTVPATSPGEEQDPTSSHNIEEEVQQLAPPPLPNHQQQNRMIPHHQTAFYQLQQVGSQQDVFHHQTAFHQSQQVVSQQNVFQQLPQSFHPSASTYQQAQMHMLPQQTADQHNYHLHLHRQRQQQAHNTFVANSFAGLSPYASINPWTYHV